MQTPASAGNLRRDINVAPLVDIVLVLLIIFIVVTPAVNSAATLPAARYGQQGEGRALTLVLGLQAGQPFVSLDDARAERFPLTALDPLQAKLSRAMDRGEALQLKADRATTFRQVDTLLAFCRTCGAQEAQLVVDSLPEGGPR